MEVFGQFLNVIYQTIVSLFPALLESMFNIKGSFDDAHDQWIAAIFGVPVIVVVIIGTVITVISIIVFIIKKVRQ